MFTTPVIRIEGRHTCEYDSLMVMDVDFTEEALQPRDPWRLYLPQPSEPSLATDTSLFNFNISFDNNPFTLQEVTQQELKLPGLQDFAYGVLEDLPPLDESLATEDDFKLDELSQLAGDTKDGTNLLWESLVDEQISTETRVSSWEAFQEPGKQEPASAYLSEAGAKAFDISLYMQEKDTELPEAILVIKNAVFLNSMFLLGLGRSSALFHYDSKTKQFEQLEREHNATGISKELMLSAIERLSHCGRLIRHLRDFVDRTYASRKTYPARVALANSIATIIDALELQLTSESRTFVSLLQLQDKFERPHRILTEVYDLARAVRSARSNEELASMVFKRCQYCDQEPEWLRSMMLKVLARVARPWLELVEQWVGFQNDFGMQLITAHDTFIGQEAEITEPKAEESMPQQLRYIFKPQKLPLFVTQEDGQTMFDIGRDIRILRTHHPEHPLAQSRIAVRNGVALQWQFDWEQVDRIASKAKEFEITLANAVKNFNKNCTNLRKSDAPTNTTTDSNPLEDVQFDPFALLSDSMEGTAHLAGQHLPDELFDIITRNLSRQQADTSNDMADFAPPTAITPVLSFNPLLAAQQRVLNAVMIRLFFRSHNLRLHLDLQRNFHLLEDGVFVSRLTAALFDPEQSSTERQRGVMRSGSGMGLRLGNRGTWPPASSELRLALMGILSECYYASFTRHSKQRGTSRNHDLPGSLSFAIRQLPEDEADKILDANSLHALDFLRLQYSPPSPLDAVLTTGVLDRYDIIFKFLLRLARMLFVVSHLPRDCTSQKARLFRWQAENFVSTCCRYFFETGVKETWSVFTQYLDNIERRLKEEDEAGEFGTRVHEGIEDVRRQHDLCLDRINFALLLRNRQQKVMKVLEDILAAILEFSKLCYEDEPSKINNERIGELHGSFDDSVKLFLEVCRGLVGKKGYGKFSGDARGGFGSKSSAGEENTIERLVTTLDFNGFYERRV